MKILLDEDAPGGPKSKGIGFVEFEDHEHALCALRQLNNNPKPWGKVRRGGASATGGDLHALTPRARRPHGQRAGQKAALSGAWRRGRSLHCTQACGC